jgi:hypothetical protein
MQCEGLECNQGDVLWVEECRDDQPPQQLFNWHYVPGSSMQWGQLQVQTNTPGEVLCLARAGEGSQSHYLQSCNYTDPEQWYNGITPETQEKEPFELIANTPDEVLSRCLTMAHHPRNFEEIYHTTCQQAKWDTTALWQVIWKEEGSEEKGFDEKDYYRLGRARSEPRCSSERTCGMCEGKCDNDSECAGKLKCFERSGDTRRKTPPGCYGEGVTSKFL